MHYDKASNCLAVFMEIMDSCSAKLVNSTTVHILICNFSLFSPQSLPFICGRRCAVYKLHVQSFGMCMWTLSRMLDISVVFLVCMLNNINGIVLYEQIVSRWVGLITVVVLCCQTSFFFYKPIVSKVFNIE